MKKELTPHKSKRYLTGFTVVELIIVIAIIAVLATISTVSFSRSKARARDSMRISDLNSVAQAILVYKSVNGSYPSNAAGGGLTYFNVTGTPLVNALVTQKYLSALPHDQKNITDPTWGDYWYYLSDSAHGNFGPILAARLEIPNSKGWIYAGTNTTDPYVTDCKRQVTSTSTEISGTGTTNTYGDPLRYCVKVLP